MTTLYTAVPLVCREREGRRRLAEAEDGELPLAGERCRAVRRAGAGAGRRRNPHCPHGFREGHSGCCAVPSKQAEV